MENEWFDPREAAQFLDISQSDFLKFLKDCQAKGIPIRRKKRGLIRRIPVFNRDDLINYKARFGK